MNQKVGNETPANFINKLSIADPLKDGDTFSYRGEGESFSALQAVILLRIQAQPINKTSVLGPI